jgi:ferredoxin
MQLFNSYTETSLGFYPEKCVGCERCTEVCPHGVFSMHGEIASLQRPEKCMECGACARNCPEGAISVEAGVGCAWAMIRAALTGSTEVTCGDQGCCGTSNDESCNCEGPAPEKKV